MTVSEGVAVAVGVDVGVIVGVGVTVSGGVAVAVGVDVGVIVGVGVGGCKEGSPAKKLPASKIKIPSAIRITPVPPFTLRICVSSVATSSEIIPNPRRVI
ncbi:MAG: hypothetical protein EF812_04035 [Methanosarcinales archaeon]|nr:MAG: hypothetical protein EF812_04035 [Methanosarcinales archaeon]